MRHPDDVDLALALIASGHTPTSASRETGIPRSTIRYWIEHGRPERDAWRARGEEPCDCAAGRASSSPAEYAYLLGLYLGDGCLSLHRRGVWCLRVTMDSAYRGIVDDCAAAITTVRQRPAGIYQRRSASCVDVTSYWKHWICLLPQHGPGRKHERVIALEAWQVRIVRAHPRSFIRGLIQSDGCRITAVERKGANERRAVRYLFSNRSEDIHRLFKETCSLIGVECTRPSAKQAAIYRKDSVAILDQFIGPKR